jgi:hypothetical protein
VEEAFEKFVEQKWRDALNVAAVEPAGWEETGARTDKPEAEKGMGCPRKAGGTGNVAGVATVEAAARRETRRKCRFFQSLGCDTDRTAFSGKLLRINSICVSNLRAAEDAGTRTQEGGLQDSGGYLYQS